MEEVLDEYVSPDDLKKFETIYNNASSQGQLTQDDTFNYAWCLTRSRYAADIKKGILLLERLYKEGNDDMKRNCLYYMAIANLKLRMKMSDTPYCIRAERRRSKLSYIGKEKGVENNRCLLESEETSSRRVSSLILSNRTGLRTSSFRTVQDHRKALDFVRSFLSIEPGNQQAQDLEEVIEKRLKSDGLKGMAMFGGGLLALGSLVGLGLALAKKH